MRGRSKQCCFLCLWALFYALIHCWQYHYFQFSIHRLRCQQENKKNETTNKWIKFCISNRAIVLVYGFACKRKLFTLPSVYTYTPWFKLLFFFLQYMLSFNWIQFHVPLYFYANANNNKKWKLFMNSTYLSYTCIALEYLWFSNCFKSFLLWVWRFFFVVSVFRRFILLY